MWELWTIVLILGGSMKVRDLPFSTIAEAGANTRPLTR